ncbi:hypothetical protein FUAX_50650 (plasmid) [Fulvitalea axinellae]|uniref:GLPGLI family protein n=1 Tax=Fulvitalea axinellae TaxID=1182444 RepID=A0AAU9CXH2_9BACT|nr:hypothetical protein FUAX_50650 [Fulvitalea axinellae]
MKVNYTEEMEKGNIQWVRCKLVLAFFIMALPLVNGFGQSDKIPESRKKALEELVVLISNNRIKELSEKVVYPLRRPNPVPDLMSPREFVQYYSILFDNSFRDKLSSTDFGPSNTINNYLGVGILNGDMWVNDEGKIIAVNYNSESERNLKMWLRKEAESITHKSLGVWEKNIVDCETDKFRIRVDKLEDGRLRYASWSLPKTLADKPDLVLYNGKQRFQGTIGGVTYTFKNGPWSYKVNIVNIAAVETAKDAGVFLVVSKGGKEIVLEKAKLTKNKR